MWPATWAHPSRLTICPSGPISLRVRTTSSRTMEWFGCTCSTSARPSEGSHRSLCPARGPRELDGLHETLAVALELARELDDHVGPVTPRDQAGQRGRAFLGVA